MKSRRRTVKSLFFRYIKGSVYDPLVSAQGLAVELQNEGLIKLAPDRLHFVETERLRSLSPAAFNQTIDSALRAVLLEERLKCYG